MRATLKATLLGTVIIVACGEAEPVDVPRFQVTDSMGVELVQNHGDSPEVGLEEELRIGSVDGPPETQFHLIRRIAVGPNGDLYVPLLGANEIRVFRADGTYRFTLGRSGQGPGEFSGLSTVHLLGDTVVAFDRSLYRMTAMRGNGDVLGTFPVPRSEGGGLVPIAPFRDGWFIDSPHPPVFPEHGRSHETRRSVVAVPGVRSVGDAMRQVEQSSEQVVRVADFSGGRIFGMTMGSALTAQRPLWEPQAGAATDGEGRLYVAAADEYRIDVFSSSGGLLRSIRRAHRPVPITGALRARFLGAVSAHYDSVEARTEFGTHPMDKERFRVQLPTVPHLPVLGRILASDEGILLAERPDRVADPVALEWSRLEVQQSHWDLFEPDGSIRGTVTLPASSTPHHLSRHGIIGVSRDGAGVEYLVRFRFRE